MEIRRASFREMLECRTMFDRFVRAKGYSSSWLSTDLWLLPIISLLGGLLVAKQDNEVVGFIGIGRGFSYSSLGLLYVKEQYRNKGIGSSLIKNALTKIKGRVKLFCKPELIGFYEAFDFKVQNVEMIHDAA